MNLLLSKHSDSIQAGFCDEVELKCELQFA